MGRKSECVKQIFRQVASSSAESELAIARGREQPAFVQYVVF